VTELGSANDKSPDLLVQGVFPVMPALDPPRIRGPPPHYNPADRNVKEQINAWFAQEAGASVGTTANALILDDTDLNTSSHLTNAGLLDDQIFVASPADTVAFRGAVHRHNLHGLRLHSGFLNDALGAIPGGVHGTDQFASVWFDFCATLDGDMKNNWSPRGDINAYFNLRVHASGGVFVVTVSQRARGTRPDCLCHDQLLTWLIALLCAGHDKQGQLLACVQRAAEINHYRAEHLHTWSYKGPMLCMAFRVVIHVVVVVRSFR
jgi:hypothetical protein